MGAASRAWSWCTLVGASVGRMSREPGYLCVRASRRCRRVVGHLVLRYLVLGGGTWKQPTTSSQLAQAARHKYRHKG